LIQPPSLAAQYRATWHCHSETRRGPVPKTACAPTLGPFSTATARPYGDVVECPFRAEENMVLPALSRGNAGTPTQRGDRENFDYMVSLALLRNSEKRSMPAITALGCAGQGKKLCHAAAMWQK